MRREERREKEQNSLIGKERVGERNEEKFGNGDVALVWNR